VTKYSAIRGVFQQPWPGVSPTASLNEEKALGTRLVVALVLVIVHSMYAKATGTVVIAPPLFSQGLGFWREWALLKLTVVT